MEDDFLKNLVENPLPTMLSLEEAQERFVLAFRALREFQMMARIPSGIEWMPKDYQAAYLYGTIAGRFREAGEVVQAIAGRGIIPADQVRGEARLKEKGK